MWAEGHVHTRSPGVVTLPRCRPDTKSAQMPRVPALCPKKRDIWILEEFLKFVLCFNRNSSCLEFSEQRTETPPSRGQTPHVPPRCLPVPSLWCVD